MPRMEVVIGASAHDVQMSGAMTGSHVGAYPLSLLTDEGSPKLLFGARTSGVSFFLGYFIFWTSKKEVPRRSRAKPTLNKDSGLKA